MAEIFAAGREKIPAPASASPCAGAGLVLYSPNIEARAFCGARCSGPDTASCFDGAGNFL